MNWALTALACAYLPTWAVAPGPDGWTILMAPSTHWAAQEPFIVSVPYGGQWTAPSDNGMYEACLEDGDLILLLVPGNDL